MISGRVQSCGCLHKEIAGINAKLYSNHKKKYNIYDLSKEYGIGYTTKGEEFYFDLEDYEKIKDICWYINNKGYVIGHIVGSRKQIKMHRYIMNLNNKDLVIDHKNTERKNDNRKENLRITTQANNTKNRRISSNNTSGVTGVGWNKRNNKWIAYIRYEDKQKFLGYFKEKEEAIKVRRIAEEKYYGEYRYINNKEDN